ncbi:hypothetical protein HDU90_004385 [Geranomyces variabilis]|nr:hypothetical protein HDU90_004385 [Geranomyces variabilis]
MDQKSWKTLHYFVKGMCAQGTLCNLPVKYAQLLLGAKMGMGIKVLLLIACVTTPHLIPWSGLVKMFVTSSTSRKQYWGTHYPFFDVGDYETERRHDSDGFSRQEEFLRTRDRFDEAEEEQSSKCGGEPLN